jgi:hypothetical protein
VDQLLSFTFELLQSILGERSENVVRSYAKRGEGHGKEFPSLAKWAIKSCVFRSLTLALNTIIFLPTPNFRELRYGEVQHSPGPEDTGSPTG